MTTTGITRRRFGALLGTALAAPALIRPAFGQEADNIRIGFVGPRSGPLGVFGDGDPFLVERFNATWANGRARARVWEEAKALNDSGRLRVTEVRGSDYICSNEQSRMGNRVVPNLILGKPVQLLGALDRGCMALHDEQAAMFQNQRNGFLRLLMFEGEFPFGSKT